MTILTTCSTYKIINLLFNRFSLADFRDGGFISFEENDDGDFYINTFKLLDIDDAIAHTACHIEAASENIYEDDFVFSIDQYKIRMPKIRKNQEILVKRLNISLDKLCKFYNED
jgi:hypothetical protein